MYVCTQNEISKHIDKLPNKTSSGHDEINNILLKTHALPTEILGNDL